MMTYRIATADVIEHIAGMINEYSVPAMVYGDASWQDCIADMQRINTNDGFTFRVAGATRDESIELTGVTLADADFALAAQLAEKFAFESGYHGITTTATGQRVVY